MWMMRLMRRRIEVVNERRFQRRDRGEEFEKVFKEYDQYGFAHYGIA